MSLLGGAECSTAGNPLSQFTKHAHDDQHIHQDRMVGRRGNDTLQGIRSDEAVGGKDEVGSRKFEECSAAHLTKVVPQVMGSFLHGSNPLRPPSPPTTHLALERIRQDLEGFQVSGSASQAQSSQWALEYHPGAETLSVMEAAFGPAETPSFTRADFTTLTALEQSKNGKGTARSSSHTVSPIMNGFRSPIGTYLRPYHGLLAHAPLATRSQPPNAQVVPKSTDSKGRGRVTELDVENWEAQFAQIDVQGQQDMDDEANAAMERELDGMDRSVSPETLHHGDFESIWKGICAEASVDREMIGDDGAWRQGMSIMDLDKWDFLDGLGTHDGFSRDPQLGDYLFEEENPFNDVRDPFGEGIRILEEGGNLSLAALAFEAAVQKDPTHVEAWTMLGNAQAQNEKESPAIRALEQALKLDPSNLSALMGLAVSYTNEGYDATAYRTLERWLASKYPDVLDPARLSAPAEFGFTDRQQLHERVTNMFIRAAQLSPDGEHMDPDVQVGLGVLFYGAEEYGKAVDCFSSALASTESGTSTQRQQVHLLWNRLGATLANSGRSEEAIAAYEKALAQKPNFVRARYNLGVSCINIGCYEEAAQHLLGALAMHKVVEQQGRDKAREVVGDHLSDGQIEQLITQNQSTNLYDTLRRVFAQMGRRDLNEKVGPGMDIDSFRREFDF